MDEERSLLVFPSTLSPNEEVLAMVLSVVIPVVDALDGTFELVSLCADRDVLDDSTFLRDDASACDGGTATDDVVDIEGAVDDDETGARGVAADCSAFTSLPFAVVIGRK